MRLRKSILILAIVMFGATISVSAAPPYDAIVSVTINEVAMLAVSTAEAPTFAVVAPASAGQMPVITPGGSPTFLQYTVVGDATPKKITAACAPVMPNGLILNVWAATPTGTGGLGIPVAGGLTVSTVATSGAATSLITGITSCATGNGLTQGPAIYYTMTINAATFSLMQVDTVRTYTVTYSLTD